MPENIEGRPRQKGDPDKEAAGVQDISSQSPNATFPSDLIAHPQWLLWRREVREKGPTKPPFTVDGDKAQVTTPETWTTFEEVKKVLDSKEWPSGLGFVFTEDDPFCGIDCDNCFIEGKLHERAAGIVRALNSYTEISPSGSGLHVIVKAKLSGGRSRTGDTPWGGVFEVYDRTRYFTMTGNRLQGSPKKIFERQTQLDGLIDELLPEPELPERALADRVPVNLSDDALLDKSRRAKNGGKFTALFDRGDVSTHGGDDSAADLALCIHLAFWTGGDPKRIDQLFRRSALMREKWYRNDYRLRTIDTAIAGCSTFFGQPRTETTDPDWEFAKESEEGEDAPTEPEVDPGASLRITPISAVTAEPVRWLWEGWWPLGAVSLIVGEPGCNKSTLCYERAARLSQGTLWGSLLDQPSNILIATAEDAPTFTLRPRLEAAGADLDRTSFLRLARGESEGDIQLPDELPLLRIAIERTKARLVIIDPLVSHLTTGVDSHKDQDIRKVLDPLARIAIDLRCSIVCIVHTNKTPSGDFFMRTGGSIGITGAARSGLLVAVDPTEEDENTPMRLVFHGKSNLGPKQRPRKFEVQSHALTPEISTARILWRGEATGIDQADALGGRRRDGYNPERNAARLWLKHLLEVKPNRSERVSVIRTEAHDSGHAWRTIERAKTELDIIANREGLLGESGWWVWTLPEGTDPQPPPSPDLEDFLGVENGPSGEAGQDDEPDKNGKQDDDHKRHDFADDVADETPKSPPHEMEAVLGENDPETGTEAQVSMPITKAATPLGGVRKAATSRGGVSTESHGLVGALSQEDEPDPSVVAESVENTIAKGGSNTTETSKAATDESISGLRENRRSDQRPPTKSEGRGDLSDLTRVTPSVSGAQESTQVTSKTTPKTTAKRKPKVSKHPAKYSDGVLTAMLRMLEALPNRPLVLDPFAGTGLVHRLSGRTSKTVGVEIEPEWASMHPNTIVGDALNLPFKDDSFDCIATSPTYGNRLADSHTAKDKSDRRSYTHDLGRKLHPNNSGSLQWGDAYRDFHKRAWAESLRVLKPGGTFILNISDHIRDGKRVPVTEWHTNTLQSLGLSLLEQKNVETPRLRRGENSEARVECEHVSRFVNIKDHPDHILSAEELQAWAD